MNATAPTIRKSAATATSGTMSAPVTGRIMLDLVAPDDRKGTGAVEQTGAGSARCGTRVPGGATVGSPVHVAVGVGVGVCLGAGVRVAVGVGVGVGVMVRMHVHVGVGAGVVMQLQSGCIVGAAPPGRMPPRTAAPGPPAVVASAIPPPNSPSRAAASATTTEAAINLTKSPVLRNEVDQLRCVTVTLM